MAMSLAVKDRVPWVYAIRSAAVEYYTLAVLSVPLWALSRRLSEKNWTRSQLVLMHALLGIATIALWQGVHVLYSRLAVGPDFWARVYGDNWPYQLMQALFLYSTLLGFILVIQASQRASAQDMREAELLLQTRDAELNAIRAQIKPHFLCNALTSLMALIDRDPAEARRMTERLGDFLRGTFDRLDDDTITLESEFELLSAYFELEGLRFQSRLRTELTISPGAAKALVPPFFLQPLVENAIKHGVAREVRGGTVRLAAHVDAQRLHITIASPPRSVNGTPVPEGRGLFLTRRRLEQVYGPDAYVLRFDDQADAFVVSLEVPVQPDGA
jgi:LytS/YehU family sensor histidine kinase